LNVPETGPIVIHKHLPKPFVLKSNTALNVPETEPIVIRKHLPKPFVIFLLYMRSNAFSFVLVLRPKHVDREYINEEYIANLGHAAGTAVG
jgi:hypothetical protein